MSVEVAPALSTAQGEDIFEFDRLKLDRIKERQYLPSHDSNDRDTIIKLLREYYSVDSLIQYIKRNPELKKITLQFPDSLVCDSSYIVQMLQEGLKSEDCTTTDKNNTDIEDFQKEVKDKNCTSSCGCNNNSSSHGVNNSDYEVWVLADTSYSSCCIDEVAAEHIGADVVIHFGDSCLNKINKLPSVFVFGKPFIDLEALKNKFIEQYTSKDEKIMLMADTCYTYCLKDFYDLLRNEGFNNLAYGEIIDDESSSTGKIIGYQAVPGVDFNSKFYINDCKRYMLGLSEEEQKKCKEDIETFLQDYNLFHITMPQSPKLLFLSTKFSSITVYDPINSSINTGPFSSLMRRYRYMHVCRTAGTIGILVNTLSLNNTKVLSDVVAKWIKDADKKYYLFVVGKPNVAKLANFDVIDCWCVLGCGQGGIIVDEDNEYYKPIVTPYELRLALSPEVSWTGKWITDFNDILKIDDEEKQQEPLEEEQDSDDAYAPEFSAVTGRYMSNSRPLRQVKHLQIELGKQRNAYDKNNNCSENQLIENLSSQVVISGEVSTSAMHLQNRQWTGLGSDYINDDDFDESGAEVEEGISGIARGYGK